MTRFVAAFLLLPAFLSADDSAIRAQEKHPAEEKGIKSLDSAIPTSLKLVNRTKQVLHIYWIDYKGKRQRNAKLAPGESFDTQTFVSHPWLVTDEKGKPWAIYLPDAQERIIEISGPVLRPVTPTSAYEKRVIEGFTILIHPELLARPKDAAQALQELEKQLKAIIGTVPAKPLTHLRKVRIWLEWDSYLASAAQFHLADPVVALRRKLMGQNTEKVGCVEINNARHFIDWSRQAQPWMVMHELAHAYHYLVLGSGHAGIRNAYRQAVERKLYESVLHVNGRKEKAYALTNEQEYLPN